MKGIILAGGMGTRLAPLTQNDNKHLLPVFQRRMIEYPVKTLVDAGVTDIILITGGKRPGAFLELLKNGKELGIDRLFYTYQEGSGGIAAALKLAEPFMEPFESCVVVLGDNYFEDGISSQLNSWDQTGSHCFLKPVDYPWDYGVAEVDDTDRIISLEEKPSNPKSNLAVLGAYCFDYNVWGGLDSIEPSARGELEITDVLESYMKIGDLTYSTYSGYWKDMGSFESWMEVSKRVADTR